MGVGAINRSIRIEPFGDLNRFGKPVSVKEADPLV